MATVYKRNGVGKYQIDWYDHTGRRRTKSSGTTCKATATRIANQLDDAAAIEKIGFKTLKDISARMMNGDGLIQQHGRAKNNSE